MPALRFLVPLLLLTATSFAVAQNAPWRQWTAGKLALHDSSVRRGMLRYDMENNTVELFNEGKPMIYTSQKVAYFELYDSARSSRLRRIYSIPYAHTDVYSAPIFFELLVEGKITLLCRERVEYNATPYMGYVGGFIDYWSLVYDYFLLDAEGDVSPFSGERLDWLNLMEDRRSDVQKFTKANRLSFSYPEDISRIVAYYNSFHTSPP